MSFSSALKLFWTPRKPRHKVQFMQQDRLQIQPSITSWEHKNTNIEIKNMAIISLIVALTGMSFAFTAMSQISTLKKEIDKLKSQVGPKS